MEASLSVVRRQQFGKNEARRLRARGLVPGIVYGGGAGPEPVAVDPKALLRVLHSESGVNTLISLTLDEAPPATVLIKEYQIDPIKHSLLHADFYRIAMDRMLRVTIPVVLRGEARGVKQQDGLLDFVHREIEVECLPGDIPEHIEVDVSELMVGQGVRVRDLPGDRKWKPISEPETLLVHVVAPKATVAEEEVAAEAPAATAEPELIKKGKAEKPEGEGR